MKVSFSSLSIPKAGILVLGVREGNTFPPFTAQVDKETKGLLAKAVKKGPFKGKLGQTLSLAAPADMAPSRILLVGLGKPKDWKPTDPEKVGGAVVKTLATAGESAAAIAVDGVDDAPMEAGAVAARVGYGGLLRSYRFDRYHTRQEEGQKPTLNRLSVMTGAAGAARTAFARMEKVADGVFLTRDLVSEPANVLYPKEFAKRAKELKDLGVKVRVLSPKDMEEMGMGALLGVGLGSAHDPQLVVLEWNGLPNGAKDKPLAFVGKGVTFDSGGISIKPAQGMEDMKWDMGGAGVVTGLMKALAGREARVHAVGILGLVENMPSHKAQRPGDVVTSMSGQTIEIINTDAEGRLVLADALWYAQEKYDPQLIIDLATLTGAIIVSLGAEYAGLFSNDEKLAEKLRAAGEKEGEGAWSMPMGEAYDKMLESLIADMKNTGERWAASITAAQFLKRFIRDVPWAHFDIAGVTWSSKESDTVPKGGTGWGVRLLDRFVADNHEAGDGDKTGGKTGGKGGGKKK